MDYQKFIEYFNENDNFCRTNEMRLTELEKGRSVMELDMTALSKNGRGFLHGGAFYTLADSAAGTAMISHGTMCVTLSGSIEYLRPIADGRVRAVATEIHRGKTIGNYDVMIYDEQGRLCAKGSFQMFNLGEPATELTLPME